MIEKREDDESLKLARKDIENVSDMLTEKIPGAEWQVCNSVEAVEFLSNPLLIKDGYNPRNRAKIKFHIR